ncbi:hypothetical protein EWM64_g4228 [Hericium alpestre]|uniref:F-box domain-containing protein n=1 Tax=Hericium alpestre TaxID=135208 RepID=A0A4Z0A032_9AGAM|nr:hypothetical protein EWM64_g4228 [Hericium alpestre]
MTHIHRIRELSIKADDRLDIHEIMRTYTRFPAPSLQTLVFSCPAYSMSFVPYFFQVLFCGQTPALRVLRVKNASFEPDMTSNLVRNLTHFEMTGAMSWRWFSKMRDFHSMLGASPHLQSLMLEYSIPSERSAPPDVTPSTPSTPEEAYTIELPSLRTIKIQDYSRSLRQFMEHLAIPPSTCVHLSMNTDDTETDDSAQGGITSLVSDIRIDPICTIHSLHFDARQSELQIRGWKQREIPKNRIHWPHETLRLVMDGYSRYLINGTLMQSITGALPLSEVQYLRADLHEPLERPVWQHLLWTMRGIEDAVVTGTITTHEFIECLGLAPDAGDGGPDEQRDACCIGYNLPLLERVTLLRIDVDDEWYECLVEGLLSRRRLRAEVEVAAHRAVQAPRPRWVVFRAARGRGLCGHAEYLGAERMELRGICRGFWEMGM